MIFAETLRAVGIELTAIPWGRIGLSVVLVVATITIRRLVTSAVRHGLVRTKTDPGLADQVGYDAFLARNHKHVLEAFAQLGREVLRGTHHGAPTFYIRRKL